MNNVTEILTRVYSFTNQMKVNLALNNIAGVWTAINALNDYLLSIDVSAPKKENGVLELGPNHFHHDDFDGDNLPEQGKYRDDPG